MRTREKHSTELPATEQPKTFTPGITRAMVREHAFRLYRDKLERGHLTLEDWVLAEKDLLSEMQKGNQPA